MGMEKLEVPIRIYSEANLCEHWHKKYKRKKQIQKAIKFSLLSMKKPKLPCEIVLTRIAPRELDYDNLCFALKPCLDYICDWIIPGLAPGRADGDKRITVTYKQKKRNPKEYALEIEFLSLSNHQT